MAVKPKKAAWKKREPKAPKIGKDGKVVPLERDEQRVVVAYCDKLDLPYYAIPNASKRTFWEAREAKLSGMKAGVPDLCFTAARLGFNGLYVEMKRREGGVLSESQKKWFATLERENYKIIKAEGAQAALDIINDYFGLAVKIC